MINTVSFARQKGYRSVAKARKYYEKQGYIVANLEKTGKFVKEKDLFGLWDILALKDRKHIFIQVKTNLSLGKKKRTKWTHEFSDFGSKHGNRYVDYLIWVCYDNKPSKVLDCETKEIQEI